MRFPVHIPLIIRNVRILGPRGSVKVDMIVDTGAALTAISWSDLKVVGYEILPKRFGNVQGLTLEFPTRVL